MVYTSDRPKTFSAEYSAEYSAEKNIRQGLPKRKKSYLVTFYSELDIFEKVKIQQGFFCQCVLHCMFLLLRIHLDHLQLPETCNCSQKKHVFIFFLIFAAFSFLCRIFVIGRIFGSFFLPNIRFRPEQNNPFSVDH
jgi:hypothetical protein